MALTGAERRMVREIEELLRIGGYDWRVVEELYGDPDNRLAQLKRIKLDFIIITNGSSLWQRVTVCQPSIAIVSWWNAVA